MHYGPDVKLRIRLAVPVQCYYVEVQHIWQKIDRKLIVYPGKHSAEIILKLVSLHIRLRNNKSTIRTMEC